jgi:ribosomal-protein-alanine N-acetyltransferase
METARLRLLPHTPEQLRALLRSVEDYAQTIGFEIEPELGVFFSQASPEYVERLWAATARDPWWDGFGMLLKAERRVVGLCGYAGPPSSEGVVEIAYGVATAYQAKGLATEAARALVSNAFTFPEIKAVCAHTLPETNSSSRVLQKCGFHHVGEATDPDAGPVWRWELKRREVK